MKKYLGDSVYIDIDDDTGSIVLTTENGLPDDPSNTIIIERELFKDLVNYIAKVDD